MASHASRDLSVGRFPGAAARVVSDERSVRAWRGKTVSGGVVDAGAAMRLLKKRVRK